MNHGDTVFTHGWLTQAQLSRLLWCLRRPQEGQPAKPRGLFGLAARRRRAQAALGACSLDFKMATTSAGLCMLRAVQCCGLGVALLLIVACITQLGRGVAAPDRVLLPQDDVVRLHAYVCVS